MMDTKALKDAFELLSVVMQTMSDEFESFRADKELPKEMRQALMHLASAHIQNASSVSYAFQASMLDPLDPDDEKLKALN